jgi:hypothetical protein
MSRKHKLLEKARTAPDNVRWNQLLALMKAWGFEEKKTTEGACFPHPILAKQGSMMPQVPKPHSDKVKQPYIKTCIKAIDLIIELQEGEKK